MSENESIDYEKVAVAFRLNVKVKDRRFRLTKYKRCFVGSDAVNFLVVSGLAPTREAAVDMGIYMQKEMNLFEHVTKEHDFEDEYLFFRFLEIKDLTVRTATPASSYTTEDRPDPPEEEKKTDEEEVFELRRRRSGLYGIRRENEVLERS